MGNAQTVCLACGVFRKELEALADKGLIDCRVRTLESMLHMNPEKLEKSLEKVLADNPLGRFLLLYGDCHPRMHEMAGYANVSGIAGMNCCEILLGKEAYRNLQREKAFIFLPEWAMRWREIFTRELGFENPENARFFLKEHLEKLVYLDTGIDPVPTQLLKEIREFFDMPLEVLPVALDYLRNAINTASHKFVGEGTV